MHFAIPRPRAIDPRVESAVARQGRSAEALLPVLRMLGDSCGGLSREILGDVAHALNLPAERVEGAATFYAMLSTEPQQQRVIRLCDGLTCWLAGAGRCRDALHEQSEDELQWSVVRSSCLGLCDRAPAAFVEGRQYGPLSPETAGSFSDRLKSNQPVSHGMQPGGFSGRSPSYAEPLQGELRVVLRRTGRVDPRSIDEALAHGAYQGLRNALAKKPQEVIREIEESGLCGRGGAGFPTGRKWRMVAESSEPARVEPVRYVICNADESEPLTFKDRVLMESDPHAVLEGMAICAYAVGAREGVIYIRGEYEPQAQLLEHAIRQAAERNLLGDSIDGGQFSFHVSVHRGAGAYICGEETALLESLEGRRGEPRIRPPYPAAHGFRGMPTVVNNVETFAAASVILQRGAAAYRRIGHPDHPGTRLFTLQGHIARTGIVELPYGLTLREMIERFGGGMRPGSTFHFALTGGAAGTFVSEKQLDVPLTPAAAEAGVTIGSGGILVCDESVSPLAVLREAMWFFEQESCGKCTPCRVGTGEARRILDGLLAGSVGPVSTGHNDALKPVLPNSRDIERLKGLADSLKNASFCALGKSADLPISTMLANFPDEARGKPRR